MSGPIGLSASTQAVNINPKAASAAASDALNFSGLAQLRSDAQAHNPSLSWRSLNSLRRG